MSILEFAGTHLQASGLGLTLGTNLFLGKLQSTPDVCVCVYEYEGARPQVTMGAAGTAVDMPRIQIVVRGAPEDYPGARNLATSCRKALAAVGDLTLGGLRVLRIEAAASVLPMGEDELNRPRLSANFQCWIEPQ